MARSKRSVRPKLVLPQEMVASILCWLPATSLLRFTSVCRSWQSIITDPDFVKTHMYYSQIMATKKASSLMITKEASYKGRPRFASINFEHYLHIPPHYRVIGSCNGILCLEASLRCYLWNPATMRSKELPKYPDFNRMVMNYNFQLQLAFGFDPLSDNYKVIRFICPNKSKPNDVPVVQLYSTDTDSWKEIKIHDKSIPKVICRPDLKLGPVINGVLYMGHMGQLISFDLHTEVFTALLFPKSKLVKSDILDFEGSVAVIFGSKRKRSPTGLWTLGILRGEPYWIKKFNIVRDGIRFVHSYLGGGLLYGKNKQNIFLGTGGHYFKNILYDYRNNEFKSFPRLAEEPEAVFRYTETLASIEGFEPSVSLISKLYPPAE